MVCLVPALILATGTYPATSGFTKKSHGGCSGGWMGTAYGMMEKGNWAVNGMGDDKYTARACILHHGSRPLAHAPSILPFPAVYVTVAQCESRLPEGVSGGKQPSSSFMGAQRQCTRGTFYSWHASPWLMVSPCHPAGQGRQAGRHVPHEVQAGRLQQLW